MQHRTGVSPWAKHHYVDHNQYEFASFLKLAEVNFNIPTLGTRDVQANYLMNSFDLNQAPQSPLIEPANFVGPANAVPEFPNEPLAVVLSTIAAVALAVVLRARRAAFPAR